MPTPYAVTRADVIGYIRRVFPDLLPQPGMTAARGIRDTQYAAFNFTTYQPVGGGLFKWEVALTNGGATIQWGGDGKGSFSTNPITITWTNNASGQTNRDFLVRGWYDADGDGAWDSQEAHRLLYVTVVKLEELTLTDAASSNSVSGPRGEAWGIGVSP